MFAAPRRIEPRPGSFTFSAAGLMRDFQTRVKLSANRSNRRFSGEDAASSQDETGSGAPRWARRRRQPRRGPLAVKAKMDALQDGPQANGIRAAANRVPGFTSRFNMTANDIRPAAILNITAAGVSYPTPKDPQICCKEEPGALRDRMSLI